MNFSLSRFSCLILLVSSFLCGCSKSIGVTGVRLSESSVTLKVGESTTISAVVEPSDADYETVKWSSSDPFVASVEDGVIRANKVGTTKVTASAGGVTSAPCNVTVDVIHVQEVSLNVSTAEMTEGEELTLYSAVFPSNAANPKVFWSSSDEKVASVSDQGVVTAVSAGIARITVTSEDMGLTATCQVTVKQKVVEVSGVTLSSEEVALKEGEKCTLVVTVSPVNATDKTVTWSSSDESVVTVDPTTGEITAVSSGEAVVLCTAGGGAKTASCRVTVAPSGIPVTGITVSPESITLALGEKASLKARITPADATDKEVIWSSSNESVVSVDPASGEITAKAIGMAVVTCTTADGSKAASCSVTVATKVPVTQVILSTNSLSLKVGQTHNLYARVLPENAANKKVTWRSNYSSIASVSSDGVVRANKEGTAIISAITDDGNKSASCRVTVTKPSDQDPEDQTGEGKLSFVPQCYIGGEKGLKSSVINYVPLYARGMDSRDERWYQSGDAKQIPAVLDLDYEVESSGFTPGSDCDYEVIMENPSQDVSIIPEFEGFSGRTLNLKATCSGSLPGGTRIKFAIKVSKGGKSMLSDYAVLEIGALDGLSIASPKAVSSKCKGLVDDHYRRGVVGISGLDQDYAYHPSMAAWIEGTDQEENWNSRDTCIAYTESLDLNTITIVHSSTPCVEMSRIMMEEYGLTFSYDIVRNYMIGNPLKDQAKSATLEHGILYARTYSTDGGDVIGATPIVRVRLVHGEDVLGVAYIKVGFSN